MTSGRSPGGAMAPRSGGSGRGPRPPGGLRPSCAGAVIYTARNFSLARQGQVTDRYTKAIEQLGSDKGLNTQIRRHLRAGAHRRDSHVDHPNRYKSWLHSSATTPASNGHWLSLALRRQNGQRALTYKRAELVQGRSVGGFREQRLGLQSSGIMSHYLHCSHVTPGGTCGLWLM